MTALAIAASGGACAQTVEQLIRSNVYYPVPPKEVLVERIAAINRARDALYPPYAELRRALQRCALATSPAKGRTAT